MQQINNDEKATINQHDISFPDNKVEFADKAYILKTKIINKISTDIQHKKFPKNDKLNIFTEHLDIINTYEIKLDSGIRKLFRTNKTIENFDDYFYFFIDSDNNVIDFSDSSKDLEKYIKHETVYKEEQITTHSFFLLIFQSLLSSLLMTCPSLFDKPTNNIAIILYIIGILLGANCLYKIKNFLSKWQKLETICRL